MRQDIRLWLSPPDPWKNHNMARGSRHGRTGTWWIEGDTYAEWKSSGPLLWIHGKRRYLASVCIPGADDYGFFLQPAQERASFGTIMFN